MTGDYMNFRWAQTRLKGLRDVADYAMTLDGVPADRMARLAEISEWASRGVRAAAMFQRDNNARLVAETGEMIPFVMEDARINSGRRPS
ncbi:MAG: hypothetical protein K2X54_08310 [Methylobacterium organophilum]|nr:hypothetical protein [Methylobacterium organophilum]